MISFAGAHNVNKWKDAVQFHAHLGLEVGAAEYRSDLRRAAFQLLGESQGGHVLLEGRGETDNVILGEVDLVGAFLDEDGAQVAAALQLLKKIFRIGPHVTFNTVFEILERTSIFTVECGRENEFSGEMVRWRIFSDAVVERSANDIGKAKVEIADITLDAGLTQSSLEQGHPQMRAAQGQERHDQEEHPLVRHRKRPQ